MKKYILIIAVLFCTSVTAQIDTVKNALLVQPVVVNVMQKDTCFQVTWSVFGVSELNVPIPYSVLSVWLDDAVIDNYILTFLGLTKR